MKTPGAHCRADPARSVELWDNDKGLLACADSFWILLTDRIAENRLRLSLDALVVSASASSVGPDGRALVNE